jgi:hypothetical protein
MIVTRASSSTAGKSVSRRQGRTLAVIPKSIIQMSPRRASFIFDFHLIQHLEPEESGVLGGIQSLLISFKRQYLLANRTTFLVSQSRQLIYDL